MVEDGMPDSLAVATLGVRHLKRLWATARDGGARAGARLAGSGGDEGSGAGGRRRHLDVSRNGSRRSGNLVLAAARAQHLGTAAAPPGVLGKPERAACLPRLRAGLGPGGSLADGRSGRNEPTRA